MNREELKPIELECNMGPDVNGVVHREPWKAYDIDEVNLLLDEKDAEIEKWKKEFEHDARFISCRMCEEKFKKYIDELKAEMESLKAKLESVQASAYADSVDAGMR